MSQPHKKNKKIQRIPRIAKRRHSEPLENSRKKPRIEIISISDSDDSIAARTKNKRYAHRQRVVLLNYYMINMFSIIHVRRLQNLKSQLKV